MNPGTMLRFDSNRRCGAERLLPGHEYGIDSVENDSDNKFGTDSSFAARLRWTH